MALLTANNQSMTAITALPSAVAKGGLVLLATETASSSATISFTSNIYSTYKEYIFKYINIHPGTDVKDLQFQADTGTNTSYNQTITSAMFRAHHLEDDTGTSLTYQDDRDLAQSTNFQSLTNAVGNGNDECCSGTLHIYDPSNTTFVKHFMSNTNEYQFENITMNCFVAGYFNTTTALTRVQFKMSTGNIDAGTIKMYGVT